MTEIETHLANSLKQLTQDYEQRGRVLTAQLQIVVTRLDAMTLNYQSLQKQTETLLQQVQQLTEDMQP